MLPEGAVEGHAPQRGVALGEVAEVDGGEVGEDFNEDLRGEGGEAGGFLGGRGLVLPCRGRRRGSITQAYSDMCSRIE